MDGTIDALLARFEGLPARDMRRAVDPLNEVRDRVRVETAHESATLRK